MVTRNDDHLYTYDNDSNDYDDNNNDDHNNIIMIRNKHNENDDIDRVNNENYG